MAATWAALIAELDPRLAILAASLPSIPPAIWAFWQFRAKRQDEREGRVLSREERRAQDLDRMQASFSADQTAWVRDLRQENKDLRVDLAETRRDRDTGWELARWWYTRAHDLLREFRNLRHTALNMQQWIQTALRRHSDLVATEVMEPIQDRPSLPLGLEDALREAAKE
jgi:hypothetical protein